MLPYVRADQFFDQEVFVFYSVKFFVENFAEHSQVIYVLKNARQRHTYFVRGFRMFLVGYRECKAVIGFVELNHNGTDAYPIYKTNDLLADSVKQSVFKSVNPVQQF